VIDPDWDASRLEIGSNPRCPVCDRFTLRIGSGPVVLCRWCEEAELVEAMHTTPEVVAQLRAQYLAFDTPGKGPEALP
jgi:hypothetical protein